MKKQFANYLSSSNFFDNSQNLTKIPYNQQDILSLSAYQEAKNTISSWDGYKVTPLHKLSKLAKDFKVSEIYYKDESQRFSLKSFKALGGAYAVSKILIKELKKSGFNAKVEDLISGKYKQQTNKITVCCATDGNHGRSVAWGSKMFNCNCEIFIHKNVSKIRQQAMADFGAKITRIQGNYDDSVKIADKFAKENNYIIVSDNSYSGYEEIPKDVMQGYAVMVGEALQQISTKPSHIFLQSGCGGIAATVVSFMLETYPINPPKFILVEPNNADCLIKSAKEGRPQIVDGELDTIMAGLACGEVSLLAWQILQNRVDGFLSIEDQPIKDLMRILATNSPPIVAGESAVAGLAGFLIISNNENICQKLDINQDSQILIFGTEGDTDPEVYQQIVGKTAQQVLNVD